MLEFPAFLPPNNLGLLFGSRAGEGSRVHLKVGTWLCTDRFTLRVVQPPVLTTFWFSGITKILKNQVIVRWLVRGLESEIITKIKRTFWFLQNPIIRIKVSTSIPTTSLSTSPHLTSIHNRLVDSVPNTIHNRLKIYWLWPSNNYFTEVITSYRQPFRFLSDFGLNYIWVPRATSCFGTWSCLSHAFES